MKHVLTFLSLLIIPFFSVAQEAKSAAIAQEIDEQVWAVFQKAYAESDAVLFNSIHTDDVLRVGPGHMRIGAEYKENNLNWMGKKDRPALTIDFVFEHRIHRETVAYEVGYYKLTYTDLKKESVGRFHVVLKKIDGTWKIAQDWDADDINGHEVTVADFERLQKQ